jgi:copper chaperone CopZ
MKKLLLLGYLIFPLTFLFSQQIRVLSVADLSYPLIGSDSTTYIKSKKIKFYVNGVCGMCKNRIETALDIEGIKFASWSIKTKMCVIKFIPEVISEREIHQLIAKLGHDTPKCKATDEDYNNLYYCCHYNREKK